MFNKQLALKESFHPPNLISECFLTNPKTDNLLKRCIQPLQNSTYQDHDDEWT